jgi:hypothetical protein
MTARPKSHLSHWTAIRVARPDEPVRTYELDRCGRLDASDVPRNPRRALTDRTKRRATSGGATEPQTAPNDLDCQSPPGISLFEWDIPEEMPGMPFDFWK